VDGLRDHFPASNAIAAQFVGYDLPRFATIASYQPFIEALCGRTISARLKVNIHHIAILVHGSP
jgi:hypothetical protein